MTSSEHEYSDLSKRSPRRERLIILRVLKLLILVAAVGAIALAALVLRSADDGGKLSGSTPPDGQTMPDLSEFAGIEPPMPAPRDVRGTAVAIVGTCRDCRSGEVIGGFLARLVDGVPDGAQVHLVAWGPRSPEFDVPDEFGARITVHEVADGERGAVQRALRIGESGIAYLYDTDGVWRTTWHLGQLDPEGFTGDLETLAE